MWTLRRNGRKFSCGLSADFEVGGRTAPYEQEFIRNDGSRWWALITAKQLDEGEAIAYVTDITKRKLAEQGLRESEARFRAISEASPALTWQVDTQGNVVYLNQRYMDMVGMNLEQLMPAGWQFSTASRGCAGLPGGLRAGDS